MLYILGGIVALAVVVFYEADGPIATADAATTPTAMLGGTPSRNMVNLVEKDVPVDFAVRPKGKEKNVKWAEVLGSKSYGRNNTFLMRVGWQQVEEVFGTLGG